MVPIKNSLRNPARNWQINPARNWQINPARNWQINPARNWQINPARNWQINPARNWQINPVRNWQINPARNWQINPARNWQINPAHNWQINPFRTSNFDGLYVFSNETNNCELYIVKVVDTPVILFFNDSNELSYFGIECNGNYSLFSLDMEYVGFMCSNGKKGYNWFNINCGWIYWVV